MKKAQEQMKSLPPEMQREDGGHDGRPRGRGHGDEGPGTRTIAGYKCENWTITIGAALEDGAVPLHGRDLPRAGLGRLP